MMKRGKRVLTVLLAASILLTTLIGTIPIVNALNETPLTLESPTDKEANMDAEAGADWIKDNLLKKATITVSSGTNGSASDSHKAKLYDGEASNEWAVERSGDINNPSVPKVVAEFDAPGKTVKEIVLANDNNYARYVYKAKITLTDKNGDTYTYEATNIDKGGVPNGYVFSRAVKDVVKVEVVATEQGSQNADDLSNGFSYLGILEKRYQYTDLKVYYAKNAPGAVGAYEDSDGLSGVYVAPNSDTGNAYALTGTAAYNLRRPRLVMGSYKFTIYAKLITPAVTSADKVIFKLKYGGQSVDIKRSDFSDTDKYVKIEKLLTFDAPQNTDFLLEYQSGSGAVKLDRFLIGYSGSETPDPVQPVPPEHDPNELELELPGVVGDEYDPIINKSWTVANLMSVATKTGMVNAVTENAEALYDGNEATAWKSDTGEALVTADFSQRTENVTVKKIILVSTYEKPGGVTKAKITFTMGDGTERYLTANSLSLQGSANEIILKNALTNVKKVVIESLDTDLLDPGWAEIAILDRRYKYERNLFLVMAGSTLKWDQGTVTPGKNETEAANPQSDWPRGVENTDRTGYMLWSSKFVKPSGNYRIAVYAKLLTQDKLGTNTQLFNVEIAGGGGTKVFKGNNFTKCNEYEILHADYTLTKMNDDRLLGYNYASGKVKIEKIIFYTTNMESQLPDVTVYQPSAPEQIPEGIEDPEVSLEAGYDPADNKNWVEANLLATPNATITVNAQDANKGALCDGNEATEWTADDQASASVTINFATPVSNLKRLILVSRYDPESYINKAKITITNSSGEDWVYEESRLRAFGESTTVTLKNAAHNVVSVKIEATDFKGENPGFAEVAVLEARYNYVRKYIRTIQAVDFAREEGRGASDGTGIVCVPTQPRGHILNTGTTVTLPACNFRTVLYVKAIDDLTLQIGNTLELKIPNSGGWRQVKGTEFARIGEYKAFVFNHKYESALSESMQIFYWAESKASVKVQKVVIMDGTSDVPLADPEVIETVPELPVGVTPADSVQYTLNATNNPIRNDNAGNPTAEYIGSSLNFSLQNHTPGGTENGKELAYVTSGSKTMRFYLRLHNKTQGAVLKMTLLRYNPETGNTVNVITSSVGIDGFLKKLDVERAFGIDFDAVEGYGYSFRIDWPANASVTLDRVEIINESDAPVTTGKVDKTIEATENNGVYTAEITKDQINDISGLSRLAVKAGNVAYELSNATLTRYLRNDSGKLIVSISPASPTEQQLIDKRISFTAERNMAFVSKSYDAVSVKVQFQSAVGTSDIVPNSGDRFTMVADEAKEADLTKVGSFVYDIEHETLTPAEWYDTENDKVTLTANGTNLYLLGLSTPKYFQWKENKPPEKEIPVIPGGYGDDDDDDDDDGETPSVNVNPGSNSNTQGNTSSNTKNTVYDYGDEYGWEYVYEEGEDDSDSSGTTSKTKIKVKKPGTSSKADKNAKDTSTEDDSILPWILIGAACFVVIAGGVTIVIVAKKRKK